MSSSAMLVRRGAVVKRKPKALFSLPALRRVEIERHAKLIGGNDLRRWLLAWVWHNDGNRKDPVGALRMAAKRMGCMLDDDAAEEILTAAKAMRQCRRADRLARFLGVTYAQRKQLGIVTIGAVDVPKRARTMLEKQKRRRRSRRRRQAAGAKPQPGWSRSKPWEAAGISRRTWYRRRAESETLAAMAEAPPPKAQH